MARMDGESTISASHHGTQCHCRHCTHRADAHFRSHLLLHHLSSWRIPRCHRMVWQEGEKEPLLLFEGTLVVEVYGARRVHRGIPCRHRQHRSVARPLLRLWSHCHNHLPTLVETVQQRSGNHRRTHRQLCFLFRRRTGTFHRRSACYCYHHRVGAHPAGMEERPHILQHHLSCGYGAIVLRPILLAEDQHRRREMPQLLALRQELQGRMHRLQKPLHRCFTLCSLRRLHRRVQPSCIEIRPCMGAQQEEREENRRQQALLPDCHGFPCHDGNGAGEEEG